MLKTVLNVIGILFFLVGVGFWCSWLFTDIELYPLIGSGIAAWGGLIGSVILFIKSLKK